MKITTPTVLLNWATAKANIERMANRAKRHGLHFRPHFKTHMSQEAGKYFREIGVDAITVSSFTMAEYFAASGWKDITVAFPANVREIETINRLAENISLNLLAVNAESVSLLKNGLRHPVGIFIKIDVGTQRTGLLPGDEAGINACLSAIETSNLLTFKGFLAHAGHSYRARSVEEVLKIHEETTAILRQLKEKYQPRYPGLIIAPGDTPTCSVAETWDGVDEIRPGNFVFYDVMQVQIGACRMEDIAVALACPVVAKHADRQEIIVYGGGVHLSKDRLTWEGVEMYGLPVLLTKDGWEMPEAGCYVRSISQEHGVIRCSPTFFEKIEIGGLVGILPVHSCLTVDLTNEYLLTTGERWPKM